MASPEHRPLAGRVAIVTGASRGIGRGLAVGLASHGAAVVCAARTERVAPGGPAGTIHETAEEIRAEGGEAIAVRCDIGSPEEVARMIAEAVSAFGRIDVLVNNAMAPTRAAFMETTTEMWDESMRVNVRGLYLVSRGVAPHMAKQGGGSIINISSGAAEHASSPFLPPGYLLYSVAKAALERFSTALAHELAPHGISVNALRPGAVKTEHAVRELGEDYDWSGWTTPDAVVPAVVFLARQIGTGYTGKILNSPEFGRTWPEA